MMCIMITKKCLKNPWVPPFRVKGLPCGDSHVDVPRGGAGMEMNIKMELISFKIKEILAFAVHQPCLPLLY